MAIDYSSQHCKAHWGFESPNWVVDDKSGLVLSQSGTPGIAQSSASVKEGGYSAFSNNIQGNHLLIADAATPAGFPLKSGDSVRKMGLHFWFNTLGGNFDRYIVNKTKAGGGSFKINYSYGAISFWWYYSGSSYNGYSIGGYTAGQWCDVYVWVDGVNRVLLGFVNGTYFYFNPPNALQVDDGEWQFAEYLSGYIDGVSIWDSPSPMNRRDIIDIGRQTYVERTPNNYAFEPKAKACWDFEPNLLVDSINGLTLTNHGATGDLNGCGSGKTALYTNTYGGDQWAGIDDSLLPADFPAKYQGTARQFSVALWYWCRASQQPRGYVFGKCGTNTGFYLLADTNSPYHLKLFWGTGSSLLTFDLGVVATISHLYFIGIKIDADAPGLYVYIHDYTADVVTEYTATPAGAMVYPNIGIGFGMLSSSGNYAGATNLDHVVFISRLLTTEEFGKIRDGLFGAASSGPPANSRSLTRCETIAANVAASRSLTLCPGVTDPPPAGLDSPTLCPAIQPMINLLRSHTLAENVPNWRPGSCQSATLCQALLMALPNSCVSKTLASDLALDGGDFFLTF